MPSLTVVAQREGEGFRESLQKRSPTLPDICGCKILIGRSNHINIFLLRECSLAEMHMFLC